MADADNSIGDRMQCQPGLESFNEAHTRAEYRYREYQSSTQASATRGKGKEQEQMKSERL